MRVSSRLETGIVIFAHGSSVDTANDAVRLVAGEVARQGGFELVEAAFLELGEPDLAAAVTRLATRGARRILIVPYFLTLGVHLQRDLPRLVERIRGVHPSLEIRVAQPLDGHPWMSQALVDRAREALRR